MIYTIKLAGPAGMGIKSSGLLLSEILINHGLNIIDYSEYPSLVRGGHNSYQVTFSKEPVFSSYKQIDLLISLAPNHHQSHLSELKEKSFIIKEDNFPFDQIFEELQNKIYLNTATVGAAAWLFNLDYNSCLQLVESRFGSESPNIKAFSLGYDHAKSNYETLTSEKFIPTKPETIIADGNESFGWGFIKGGGKFYAAYPMTPATGTLHFLAKNQTKYDLKVVHPEDEIAASNMASGAVFAGVKSAVGTSGGGFALMNETVSFNGVAEIGLVYYLVSRPGPATGMPTWTSQGDLLHAIYSGHGEFPKIVLAAGDQQEAFELGVESLNLAAEFQTPVILLSDKLIGESDASLVNLETVKVDEVNPELENNPKDFNRYAITPSGISPLTIPGTANGEYLANSYEHDEFGFSVEDANQAKAMMDKRFRKVKSIIKKTPKPVFYNSNSQSDNLIISWGSPKGAILETLKDEKLAKNFSFLHFKTLWPIDPQTQLLIKPFKNIIVIENNQTNQLTTVLKSQFDFNPSHQISKYDGRPFFPEELSKELYDLLKS